MAPSSCAEIPGARVHVRPCAAPLPRVLPAAPPPCLLRGGASLRPPLPHCTAAVSPLTRARLCAAEFSRLSAGHGHEAARLLTVQTVPPAKVDGGLPAASLVRGEQLPAVLPVSLCRPFAQWLQSVTDSSLHTGSVGRFQRAAWLETEAAGPTVVRASPLCHLTCPSGRFCIRLTFLGK